MLELTEYDEAIWGEYVRSAKEAHFYFDYRWKKVLEESFGHNAFYLIAREDGKTAGIFPLIFIKGRITRPSLVSIPFLNYGGILAESEETEAFLLARAVDKLRKTHASYIEMRCIDKLDLDLVTREHKVTMRLSLSRDTSAQWEGLDAKVKNQIRKGRKAGLAARSGKKEMLGRFYDVFCRNMRDLGTPVIGIEFFENILKYFTAESSIFIVELNGRAVAGAFTLSHGDTMEVPWASSIRAFNKLCPNELLYWEMIAHAVRQGLGRFDFGRCTRDSGTYRFKKQWNPEIKQLYWQYWASDRSMLPLDNPKKSAFTPLIAVWKRLPLAIANRLGPCIAKYIPIF